MKRTSLLIAAALAALSALAFSQQSQEAPALPAAIVGPQLIQWSELQKPQPIPQPVPPPEKPDQDQSGQQQPSQQQPGQTEPATSSQAQGQPSAQTFTGTIVKDGSNYVLKANGTAYQVDDQDKAKQYEGKQVKITGSLD